MGWSIGYDARWKRWIGYGVPCFCDAPGCSEEIDRGLAFVCGGEPYGGEHGCGLFFCAAHRHSHTFGRGRNAETVEVCARCDHHRLPYKPKPEHSDWVHHLLTDSSWAKWRSEYPREVCELTAAYPPRAGRNL